MKKEKKVMERDGRGGHSQSQRQKGRNFKNKARRKVDERDKQKTIKEIELRMEKIVTVMAERVGERQTDR